MVGLPKMCWGKWSENLKGLEVVCHLGCGVKLQDRQDQQFFLRDSLVAEKVLCSVSFREKFVYLADSRTGDRYDM